MLPQSNDPLLDIVMLVHDKASWADIAIRAVEAHTKNRFRLIVVDMASQEERTHALFKEVEARGHTVIHLAENRSFSNGVNAGVNAGSSRFICVLNDDAIVTEGWDTLMLQDAVPREIGLVGARSNYAGGAQGDPSFTGDPPFLVFVCVVLRRNVWEAVGPLDEKTFDGFSSEDLDYSWRVQAAGYKLKVSQAFVLHAGSRTLLATQPDLAKNNERYMLRLIDKWGKETVAARTKLKQNVFVVSYSAEEWTRVSFMGAMLTLRRSDGISFNFHNMTRAPIHLARQLAADYALDNGYDWIVQLDDDATFPSDVIRKLIAHNKDVVTALAYQRKPPYATCCFELGEGGLLGAHLEGIEHTGLRRVDVSGFHVSIMHTSVIKRLRAGVGTPGEPGYVPGTRIYYGGFDNKLGEDFAFCVNLKRLGIPVYCDTDVIAGHLGASVHVDENYKKLYLAGKAP